MFFLQALKRLEEKENVNGTISALRINLFAQVATVGIQPELPTNIRDKELIESFYLEVMDYLNEHVGLHDTYRVIENGETVEKQSGYSILLQKFA